jgi:hypothetical protein
MKAVVSSNGCRYPKPLLQSIQFLYELVTLLHESQRLVHSSVQVSKFVKENSLFHIIDLGSKFYTLLSLLSF